MFVCLFFSAVSRDILTYALVRAIKFLFFNKVYICIIKFYSYPTLFISEDQAVYCHFIIPSVHLSVRLSFCLSVCFLLVNYTSPLCTRLYQSIRFEGNMIFSALIQDKFTTSNCSIICLSVSLLVKVSLLMDIMLVM